VDDDAVLIQRVDAFLQQPDQIAPVQQFLLSQMTDQTLQVYRELVN
jgi:hypothetical protein